MTREELKSRIDAILGMAWVAAKFTPTSSRTARDDQAVVFLQGLAAQDWVCDVLLDLITRFPGGNVPPHELAAALRYVGPRPV